MFWISQNKRKKIKYFRKYHCGDPQMNTLNANLWQLSKSALFFQLHSSQLILIMLRKVGYFQHSSQIPYQLELGLMWNISSLGDGSAWGWYIPYRPWPFLLREEVHQVVQVILLTSPPLVSSDMLPSGLSSVLQWKTTHHITCIHKILAFALLCCWLKIWPLSPTVLENAKALQPHGSKRSLKKVCIFSTPYLEASTAMQVKCRRNNPCSMCRHMPTHTCMHTHTSPPISYQWLNDFDVYRTAIFSLVSNMQLIWS